MVDVAGLLNQVSEVLNGVVPASPTTPKTNTDGTLAPANPMPRWQRILAGTLPEVGASILSAPTDIYSLADAGSRWAFNKPLPGGEGARDFSNAIHAPVRELSNKMAGETVQDNLLTGDPEQLLGAWTRLGLTAGAVAPAGVAVAATNAASKLKTGIDIVDKIGTGALKTLEVLSPVVISKNPTPGLVAANIGIAGGLGAGLEAVLGPDDSVHEVKKKLDSYSQGVQDSAAEGIQQQRQLAGFGGNGGWEDAAAFALLGAAVLGTWKRDVAYRALTGLDKGEVTQVPLGTIIREQLSDSTAPIDNINRQALGVPVSVKERLSAFMKGQDNEKAKDIADAFESRMAERHGAAIDTKLQQVYEFGELPQSSIKVTPLNDSMTKYRALSPEQQKSLSDILNARHEIDSRQRIMNSGDGITGANVGKIGTPQADHLFQSITRMRPNYDAAVRYHMYETPTKDLYTVWNNRAVDQQVGQLADEYFNTLRKMPDYLYEQRALSKQDRINMARQNPNYVATELAKGNSHLSEINLKPGTGSLTPGNPFEELPRYFEQVVRFAEANKVRRESLGTMLRRAEAGDPFAKKLIGRVDKNLHASSHEADKVVRFRDFDGRSRDVEVLDPVYRRALQNVGRPAALTLIQGNNKFLTGMSRFFENAAVGPLAAATGTMFAPIGAAYSMVAGTAMRDKRFGAAGWLDKAVQHLTQGKIGVRGDVLTLAPDAAFRAAQGISAVFAQRAARVLKDSVLTDGRLSKVLGPQTAQVVGDAMSSYFKRSWVSELQKRGQLGPASLMTIDHAKRFTNPEKMLQGESVVGKTGGLVSDILHAISSAPAASLYAMNKNNPVWKTNTLVREFSGDPSKSGAFSSSVFKPVGTATAITPWGNIFIQANLRLAKAFKDNPVATTVGIFNVVALPTILSTVHNASLGPEYSDYQYNVRSPDRQAGYIYIARAGKPPEQGYEIPIDPVMRPFKHGAEVLAGAQLGLLDGSLFKPGNETAVQALQDMAGRRQLGMGEGSVGQSILQQSILPPLPPVASAIGAVAGVKLRSYVDASNISSGRGGFTEGQGKNPHRSFLGMHEYPQMEEVVSAIGADAGRFIYNLMMDSGQMVAEGAGKDIPKRIVQKGEQRLGDSTKYLSGPLFETFQAISPSTEAAAQSVKAKIDTMKKINQAYNDTTDRGAAIGNFVGSPKRGYQQGLGQGPVGPADPGVAQIAEIVHRLGPELAKEYEGTNKDLYNLRSQVANSTQFSPQMKRALMNGYSEQIITNNRGLLQKLEMIESNLSQQFGVQIKLDKIDLGKGIDQFKPILSPQQAK